jgi:hypothetical protein
MMRILRVAENWLSSASNPLSAVQGRPVGCCLAAPPTKRAPPGLSTPRCTATPRPEPDPRRSPELLPFFLVRGVRLDLASSTGQGRAAGDQVQYAHLLALGNQRPVMPSRRWRVLHSPSDGFQLISPRFQHPSSVFLLPRRSAQLCPPSRPSSEAKPLVAGRRNRPHAVPPTVRWPHSVPTSRCSLCPSAWPRRGS